MHPAEEFIKEFKETQDHIYDKGYWAGKLYPISWANHKWVKIGSWVAVILLVPLIVWQIISGLVYLFS